MTAALWLLAASIALNVWLIWLARRLWCQADQYRRLWILRLQPEAKRVSLNWLGDVPKKARFIEPAS